MTNDDTFLVVATAPRHTEQERKSERNEPRHEAPLWEIGLVERLVGETVPARRFFHALTVLHDPFAAELRAHAIAKTVRST